MLFFTIYCGILVGGNLYYAIAERSFKSGLCVEITLIIWLLMVLVDDYNKRN